MKWLRNRKDDHLARKLFHIFWGTLAAFLYAEYLSRFQALVLLGVGATLFVPIDIIRLYYPAVNKFFVRKVGFLMRTNERKEITAQVYFIFGLIWLMCVPKVIAIHSMLILAWMDPASSFFGIRFGHTKWDRVLNRLLLEERDWGQILSRKTFEGSFAGFVLALGAGVIAWTGPWASVPGAEGIPRFWPGPLQIVFFSLLGAFTSVIAEIWPSQWDDNFMIPFWTSVTLWIGAAVLGIPMQF